MADDKKVIFSMVGVSKTFPPQKKVLNNIYLSFFYGAKIGIIEHSVVLSGKCRIYIREAVTFYGAESLVVKASLCF